MKIKLAHHYWQNQTNAAWYPKLFPFPAIEEQIKKNYALLEAERPKWKQYGTITVFFDYRPTKDIYGRDIVPISFAFVPDCQDPARYYPFVVKKLRHTPVTETEMEVEFPAGKLVAGKKSRRFIMFSVCLAILSIILASFLHMGHKGQTKQTSQIAGIKENSVPGENSKTLANNLNVEHLGQDMTSSSLKNQRKMPDTKEVETQNPLKAEIQEKSYPKLSPLCEQRDLRDSMNECARAYFDQYCDNGIKTLKNFKEWDMEIKTSICSRKRIPPDSKDYPIFRNSVDNRLKREMEKLFNRGR